LYFLSHLFLGSKLDNIVVRTFEEAKKCSNYLKEKRLGRATFMYLENQENKYEMEKHF
jgi:chromosome segregation ATPase